MISRNLKFENVKNLLERYQNKQIKVQDICHKQIRKYIGFIIDNFPLKNSQIELIYKSAIELDNELYNSNKEIANLSLLLNSTLQRFIKYYDLNTTFITSELYDFYYKLLNIILNHSLKLISFPTLIQLIFYTKRIELYKKQLNKYLFKEKYKTLNFIELGVTINLTSKSFVLFFDEINFLKNILIKKAAFRCINSPIPIVRLLYLNKIYFPPIIITKRKDIIKNNIKFYMIGFNIQYGIATTINNNEK